MVLTKALAVPVMSTCNHGIVRHAVKHHINLLTCESLKDMRAELFNMIMNIMNSEQFDFPVVRRQ